MRATMGFRAGTLGLALLLGACAMADDISCDPAAIGPPVPSVLGQNYARYAAPLPAILSQGEAERIGNAGRSFDTFAPGVQRAMKQEWRRTLRRLFAGTLPNISDGSAESIDFDFLRGAAPTMLARLKACGPAADPRLSYLADIPLESPVGDTE